MFVEELPSLKAVVELSDHAIEQVTLSLGMPALSARATSW